MKMLRILFAIAIAVPGLFSQEQNILLQELANEDQSVRFGNSDTRSDEERIKIIIKILAEESNLTPQDKFNAALILQHTPLTFVGNKLVSTSPDNYLLAHHLFNVAANFGIKEARYLSACAIDRYLSFTVGYQKFGTNRIINQETGAEELVPIDRNTSDNERAKLDVPTLSKLLESYPEQKKQ